MKLAFRKIVFCLGLVSLISIIYVISFYVTKNQIIDPFEKENRNTVHSVRPFYNIAYYPLRLFYANGSSFRDRRKIEVHFGSFSLQSQKSSNTAYNRGIILKTMKPSTEYIGFTGAEDMLEKFDRIEPGSYVKLVFDQAISRTKDFYVNNLIDFELINLMDDPRIQPEEISEEESTKQFDLFLSLRGTSSKCVGKFYDDYATKVMEHCVQSGYANHIMGGCAHRGMPPRYSPTLVKHALKSCNVEVPLSK